MGGDTYLSGPKGRDYLDVALFEKKGIRVEFQDFKHPVYKQRYEGFEPNMAAIDALFNVGEDTGMRNPKSKYYPIPSKFKFPNPN